MLKKELRLEIEHIKIQIPLKLIKKKVENFLKSMDDEEDSTDFSEGLANFEPPKYPEMTKQPEQKEESVIDNSVSPET